MANKFEMPAFDSDRLKAAFAEAGERSKAAREQLVARRDELVQFNKDNLEAVKASGRIFAEGAKPLAEEVVANAKRQLATAGEVAKSFRAAKTAAERLQLQRDAAKTSLAAVQADTKAFGQSVAKLVNDAAVPLKGRLDATFNREPVAA